MRCKLCDYPLWNTPAGPCPECGGVFRPSDFTFLPNAVKFLCPHCRQDYYGTTDRGHLDPPDFACVRCAQPLTLDAMLVLPRQEIGEALGAPASVRWLTRPNGMLRAALATGWQSLVAPAMLARGLPDEPRVRTAIHFAVVWACLAAGMAAVLSVLTCGGLAVLTRAGQGAAANPATAFLGSSTLITGASFMLGVPVVLLTLTATWALGTHGILRLFGARTASLPRTIECFAYSAPISFVGWIAGPLLLCAFPLLALGFLIMGICCGVMLSIRQRVRGWTAFASLIIPPLILAVLVAAVILLASAFSPGPRVVNVTPVGPPVQIRGIGPAPTPVPGSPLPGQPTDTAPGPSDPAPSPAAPDPPSR